MFIPFFIFLFYKLNTTTINEISNTQKGFSFISRWNNFLRKICWNRRDLYWRNLFNTGMTGYQEIFTDPSYFGQLMVTTNAHIGNYGVNANEVESDGIKISGLICRNFSFTHSRIDSDGNLKDWFLKHNIVAISDVDTRALVSYIRDNGAMNAIISTEIDNIDL